MNNTLLIHAWRIHKCGINYYLPYTHWIYLVEISKLYKRICLLSPTEIVDSVQMENLVKLDFENVSVYELPDASRYIDAIKNFPFYIRAYQKLKAYDEAYSRYPVPFGWLQAIYFRNKRKIIHYVGDPADTVKSNPNLSNFKKQLLLTFFKPEHQLYISASKKAEVYTNGFALGEKLNEKKIKSIPLISSTLNEEDYFFDTNRHLVKNAPKLVYVGYLRKAKGVETLIYAFKQLKDIFSKATFTIVGTGESERYLKEIVRKEAIRDINFLGHVDDRPTLNQILRSQDIFCFASLSEGSPRVILEAMANGLPVVSTPVGSLPKTFERDKEIIFANYNDPANFTEKVIELILRPSLFNEIRSNGYIKAKSHTIETFIKRIFCDIQKN